MVHFSVRTNWSNIFGLRYCVVNLNISNNKSVCHQKDNNFFFALVIKLRSFSHNKNSTEVKLRRSLERRGMKVSGSMTE